MIDPPLNKLLEKVDCRYTLVSVISKRARQIVDKALKEGEFNVKPVSMAVVDLMAGKTQYTHCNQDEVIL